MGPWSDNLNLSHFLCMIPKIRPGFRVDLVTPEGLHPLIRDQVLHEVVYV